MPGPEPDLEVLTLSARSDQGAQPIVFVHGICHGAWCWMTHYAPYFADQGHDVWALSLRGHAGSAGHTDLDQAGLQDYVEDVIGVLTQLTNRPVLVGHSMGGAVAHLAVSERPELVSGLALLAALPPGGSTMRESLRALAPPLSTIALLRLLSGRRLSPTATNRLPFFRGRLSLDQAEAVSRQLGPESRRALRDIRGYAPAPGPLPVPLLVLGSRQDAIFGAAAVQRTARHHGVAATVLDEGCHDLMLDPSWRVSAELISSFVQNRCSPVEP